MAKLSAYLSDPAGNPSSTRLFSWILLWLFVFTNSLVFIGVGWGDLTIDMNFIMLFLIYDA